jgi:hypothetical protein
MCLCSRPWARALGRAKRLQAIVPSTLRSCALLQRTSCWAGPPGRPACGGRADSGDSKQLSDAVHFSKPTAPPGTDHPEPHHDPAGAPPETVKVEPAPGVKTAGKGGG